MPGTIGHDGVLRMPEPSVNDIPDNELLGRAVRDCRRGRGRGRAPLWSVVSYRFALGSGYSAQLCRRYGLDPEERVRVSNWVVR